MAAYRRVDDLRSPAGWLPVHRDQLRAQRSVSSMGSLYLFLFLICHQLASLDVACVTGLWRWISSGCLIFNSLERRGCETRGVYMSVFVIRLLAGFLRILWVSFHGTLRKGCYGVRNIQLDFGDGFFHNWGSVPHYNFCSYVKNQNH